MLAARWLAQAPVAAVLISHIIPHKHILWVFVRNALLRFFLCVPRRSFLHKILFFQSGGIDIFLISPCEALLMSIHNVCFCGEIRKIFTWYPLLSRPGIDKKKYLHVYLIPLYLELCKALFSTKMFWYFSISPGKLALWRLSKGLFGKGLKNAKHNLYHISFYYYFLYFCKKICLDISCES